MVSILKDLGVLQRIGYFTLDNASNCDTLVDQVSQELEALNIGFTRDQNRLRCFPHVVNLAVQDFLDNLSSELPPEIAAIYSGNDLSRLKQLLDEDSFDGEDIVHRIRGLVAALRVSGQRRETFQRIIISGNAGRLWDNALDIWKTWWVDMDPEFRMSDIAIQLPVVQPLLDCPTRWSSSFVMLHRFLELYPAINHFVNTTEELSKFKITRPDIERLSTFTKPCGSHMRHSSCFPMKWMELKSNIPELQVPLTIGISKIQDYITKTRKSDVYALAMVINPTMKLDWVKNHWTAKEAEEAEAVVMKTMLEFRMASRRASAAALAAASAIRPLPIASPSRPRANHPSARSQGKGLANFLGISTARRTGSSTPVPASTLPASATTHSPASESEAAEVANDKFLINAELLRYKQAGVVSGEALEDFDLLRFWEASTIHSADRA
ncbi:hypothetical protein FS837_000278, partial [Tulasnella sp. UAMH 9824]